MMRNPKPTRNNGGKDLVVVLGILLLVGLIVLGGTIPGSSGNSAHSAEATLSAGEYAIRSVRLTEAAVERSMAGASATQRYFAAATMRALKATETARSARATAQAQATADMQAALAAHATATAQALRYAMTQEAVSLRTTATVQVLHAQATALAAQAQRVELEVEQQKRMAFVWGVTKWLLVILFAGIIVFILYRLATFRVIHRPNGKVLVVVGGVVYDPDRNPTPILQVGPSGAALPPVSEETQAATTARDQAVAFAAVGGGKKSNPFSNDQQPPLRFRILRPGERPPMVDTGTLEVLEAEWREADE